MPPASADPFLLAGLGAGEPDAPADDGRAAWSRRRLELAIGASGLGIWDVDLVHQVQYWDAEVCRIFGVAPSRAARPLTDWSERIHPDDRAGTLALHQQALAGGRPVEAEYRIVRDDGTIRFLRSRWVPVLGSSGAAVRLVGTDLDLTELVGAQHDALAAAARLAVAMDVGQVGTLEIDERGRITGDGIAAQLLGCDPGPGAEAGGWFAGIHPHDQALLSAALDRALAGGSEQRIEARVGGPGPGARHLLIRLRGRAPGATPAGGAFGVLVDLSPVRIAESEAFEAVALLRLTAEGAGVGFWRWRPSEDQIEPDRQARRLLELPAEGAISFAAWSEAMHPDDRAEVRARLQRALQRGGAFDMEYRVRSRGGEIRHLADRGVVQFDAAGRPTSMTGIVWDLTPRRVAEAAARGANARLQIASRSTGFGLWEWEIGSDRVLLDPQMRALVGSGPGDELDFDRIDTLRARLDEEEVARVAAAVDAAVAGTAALDVEARVRRVDGSYRWLAARGHVERTPGGRPVRIQGVGWDVTERREAERRAHDAAQRLKLITGATGLGIWERDLASGESTWDAGMYALFGRQPDERSPHEIWSTQLHAEDRARLSAVQQTAVDSSGSYQEAFRVIRPDGEVRWLAVRGVVPPATDRGSRHAIGVYWDVTEARRAEHAERARETAERANRAKSEFLARMSHELRTPLNAILGFAQLLELDRDDPLSPGQRERVGRIHDAGWHLLRLIGDVLDLTRIEAGSAALTMEIVALEPMLSEAVAMVLPELQSRGLSLARTHAANAPRHAWADGTRLKQVLLNLLSNAVRYNRPGGSVRIGIDRHGEDRVAIRVIDSGRGLSAAQRAQLFQPFNRLGAENLEPGGTGIGLAISQRLVEQMHGTIEVDSEAGSGSEFRVVLNAARVETPTAGTAPERLDDPEPAGQLREDRVGRVLYIEDNPANSALVEQLLHFRPGVTLYKAPDGETGLVLADACRPDLILIDMRLPDIDGMQVLERLRQQPETAGVPCVAVSANAMPEDIGRALAGGFVEYWTKPLDALQFLRGVDRYLVEAAASRDGVPADTQRTAST